MVGVVVLGKDNITLIDWAGKTATIEGRIKQIRAQIEETPWPPQTAQVRSRGNPQCSQNFGVARLS